MRPLFFLILTTTALTCSSVSVFASESTLWMGTLQLWTKSAANALPQPLSAKIPVQFEMQRPNGDYETFHRSFKTQVDSITVSVTAYWNRKPNQDTALIQIQIPRIAECSFYFEPWKDQKFPGGACSGFSKNQIGVTIQPQ